MRVTIFGCGYVGLVSAASFAQVGHKVICVDNDAAKLNLLQQGISPIYEPGLTELLKKNIAEERLFFTSDAVDGINQSDILFIAVGTPSHLDGSPNLDAFFSVAATIGQHMNSKKIIVNKSTVPVGSGSKVKLIILQQLQARNLALDFHIVSNPEFLKEGAAIEDFTKPDRIIVGAEHEESTDAMRELYAPFNRNHDRFMVMDIRSAELTKYAANAMLATKISVMNEFANLAEKLGADIEKVRVGIGADPRIGYDFIYPGCGYGGSCFPKDVRALLSAGSDADLPMLLLDAVDKVNERQKLRLFHKIHQFFNADLQNKVIALWGLAFKPNTDDIREASSRILMENLWQQGAKVQAYDPSAMAAINKNYGLRADLQLGDTPYEVLQGADVLVIVTEWQEFRSPDFQRIKQLLKQPVIFDGRNIYDPKKMQELNIIYYGIGRGESIATI